jgi:hypothetical protein
MGLPAQGSAAADLVGAYGLGVIRSCPGLDRSGRAPVVADDAVGRWIALMLLEA